MLTKRSIHSGYFCFSGDGPVYPIGAERAGPGYGRRQRVHRHGGHAAGNQEPLPAAQAQGGRGGGPGAGPDPPIGGIPAIQADRPGNAGL